MQARLAYRCALVLRDLIHPYLLRRQKKDLEDVIHLPAKTEQVRLCRFVVRKYTSEIIFDQAACIKRSCTEWPSGPLLDITGSVSIEQCNNVA